MYLNIKPLILNRNGEEQPLGSVDQKAQTQRRQLLKDVSFQSLGFRAFTVGFRVLCFRIQEFRVPG